MLESEKVYRDSFFQGLLPDPNLRVSEWADEYRMLSQKSSSEPGHWRTARTPYLREIMDCLSPSSPIQKVVFQAGAQVGKTECGNNWIGYIIDASPGPTLIVQPTVELAKRMSKQRLAPMIDETPVLRKKINSARSRDSGNTMQSKEFPGGIMVLTGANSAVGLRSMPVKYLFLDEIDAYPFDVDEEGDPVNLAERRTTTFTRKKIYLCSTPKIKDISRIERAYLESDQRRYFVPCPHCGEYDWLKFENIIFEDHNPDTTMLKCCACGVLIEERYKTQMLAEGQWRPTNPKGDPNVAGFHLSALYSPLGWKSWKEIVREFLKAKSDPPLLKEWKNTVLGETWEDDFAVKVAAEGLRERAENYEALFAPTGVLAITVGVDCQDDRLAVVMRGFGRDEESWLLYWTEIYGDPAKDEVWKQLDDILLKPVRHESGCTLPIYVTGIDSGGHHTHEVYNYARQRRARHVLALKGSSTRGKNALSRPSKVDINFRGKFIKLGAEVWLVGTDTIKSVIYSRLKLPKHGKGFYHFYKDVSDDYFEQVTAEKQVTKYLRGYPYREWQKKASARNEALDCEVYAYAALQNLYMRFNRKTIWDQLEARITAPQLALATPADSAMPAVQPAAEEAATTLETPPDAKPLQKTKPPVSMTPPAKNFGTDY